MQNKKHIEIMEEGGFTIHTRKKNSRYLSNKRFKKHSTKHSFNFLTNSFELTDETISKTFSKIEKLKFVPF